MRILTFIFASFLLSSLILFQKDIRSHSSSWRRRLDKKEKRVKVIVMMGQSNMVGYGLVDKKDSRKLKENGTLSYAVEKKGLYTFLKSSSRNKWATLPTVRYVAAQPVPSAPMQRLVNQWLSPPTRTEQDTIGFIGPELGMAHVLAQYMEKDTPILVLKPCIGGRSLGWDFLPPGSEAYEKKEQGRTFVYAGYGDSTKKYEKGTDPAKQKTSWHAGLQLELDTSVANEILKDISDYYPGATAYDIEAIVWWQGFEDSKESGHAHHYRQNLKRLIPAVRESLNAPNASFVMASVGWPTHDEDLDPDIVRRLDEVHRAQLATAKDGTLGDNVAVVDTRPFWQPGGPNEGAVSHYLWNAELYMNVGISMGFAALHLMGLGPDCHEMENCVRKFAHKGKF